MAKSKITYKRWYDEDPIVAKCVELLENISDSVKRQTATYLMDEIVNKQPFSDMLPDEVFSIATEEEKKRRWYDYDEVTRLFIELLKHAPAEVKTQISVLAITFVESLILDKKDSIAIEVKEKDKYLNVENIENN